MFVESKTFYKSVLPNIKPKMSNKTSDRYTPKLIFKNGFEKLALCITISKKKIIL